MFLRNISKVITSILLIALVVLCIIYQNQISTDVYNSLVRCVTRIIPSLFAMTVLSSVILRSGLVDKIFANSRVNTTALSCLIFGNIGGYPIGAKLISDTVLSNKLSKSEAEKVISFSFNCGPSFAIGVSYTVYGNNIFGLAAFACIVISNLILYLIYIIKYRSESERRRTKTRFSTSLVVESVSNAAGSMISITAMIAAFSVVISLLKCLFPSIFISFVPSVFEISNITELYYPPLYLTTALLAFGGLCVHMQVAALVNDAFSLKLFYITRLIQILIAVGISALIDNAFKLSNSISALSPYIHFSQSNSIIPLICMLAMLSIVLLYKTKRRTA